MIRLRFGVMCVLRSLCSDSTNMRAISSQKKRRRGVSVGVFK